jgi:hypothetical protein
MCSSASLARSSLSLFRNAARDSEDIVAYKWFSIQELWKYYSRDLRVASWGLEAGNNVLQSPKRNDVRVNVKPKKWGRILRALPRATGVLPRHKALDDCSLIFLTMSSACI